MKPICAKLRCGTLRPQHADRTVRGEVEQMVRPCYRQHFSQRYVSRSRTHRAPDALDARPELTTMAGQMAQNVLGCAESVIRGFDTDRVLTPPRESDLN